jgi:hypothetical protein
MPEELHSSTEASLPPGWTKPKPEALAEPTWWPAFLSLGATFIVWGLLASFIIVIIGLMVFGVSLAGWIGDIRREHKGH